MSATVMPRSKAATLMRPRNAGVTSIVSRAEKVSAFDAGVELSWPVSIQCSAGSRGRAPMSLPGRAVMTRPAAARW